MTAAQAHLLPTQLLPTDGVLNSPGMLVVSGSDGDAALPACVMPTVVLSAIVVADAAVLLRVDAATVVVVASPVLVVAGVDNVSIAVVVVFTVVVTAATVEG